MPSYFIYVTALLSPLVWHSLQAIIQVSPLFLSTTVSHIWFLFLMFSTEFNSLGNSCNITRHLLLRLLSATNAVVGPRWIKRAKTASQSLWGIILRSGWNQKFCRFHLTRALLNGLSQASVHSAKAVRYCSVTAKVAGCIADMYPAQRALRLSLLHDWLFKCCIPGTQQ